MPFPAFLKPAAKKPEPATRKVAANASPGKIEPSARPVTHGIKAPTPKQSPKMALGWQAVKNYLSIDAVRTDVVMDEAAELARFHKVVRRIIVNSYVIVALGLVLIIGMPFFEPHYRYIAMKPDKEMMQMVGLNMPNMTNGALLSWATVSNHGNHDHGIRRLRNPSARPAQPLHRKRLGKLC